MTQLLAFPMQTTHSHLVQEIPTVVSQPRSHLVPQALLILLVLVPGCSEEPNGDPASLATLPASLWLTKAPENAAGVAPTRASAETDAQVVVKGRVKDFVPNYAAFTLIDMALTPCNEREGDACPTPWDYCCEEASVQTANTLTIEIHGADGRPLRVSLQGIHGIDHLVPLIVTGKVARDEAGNVTVIAERIFTDERG